VLGRKHLICSQMEKCACASGHTGPWQNGRDAAQATERAIQSKSPSNLNIGDVGAMGLLGRANAVLVLFTFSIALQMIENLTRSEGWSTAGPCGYRADEARGSSAAIPGEASLGSWRESVHGGRADLSMHMNATFE